MHNVGDEMRHGLLAHVLTSRHTVFKGLHRSIFLTALVRIGSIVVLKFFKLLGSQVVLLLVVSRAKENISLEVLCFREVM